MATCLLGLITCYDKEAWQEVDLEKLLAYASVRMLVLSRLSVSRAFSRVTLTSVSVPVLSMHMTSLQGVSTFRVSDDVS